MNQFARCSKVSASSASNHAKCADVLISVDGEIRWNFRKFKRESLTEPPRLNHLDRTTWIEPPVPNHLN